MFNEDSVNILSNQQTQDVHDQQEHNADGKCRYRFPVCQISFKFDGASRRRHELLHDPPPVVLEQPHSQ